MAGKIFNFYVQVVGKLETLGKNQLKFYYPEVIKLNTLAYIFSGISLYMYICIQILNIFS